MDIVYGIMLDNGSGYNARCDSSLGLHVGDFCVIRKDFYLDYGQIVKQFDAPPPESTPAAPVEEERESGGTVFSFGVDKKKDKRSLADLAKNKVLVTAW